MKNIKIILLAMSVSIFGMENENNFKNENQYNIEKEQLIKQERGEFFRERYWCLEKNILKQLLNIVEINTNNESIYKIKNNNNFNLNEIETAIFTLKIKCLSEYIDNHDSTKKKKIK